MNSDNQLSKQRYFNMALWAILHLALIVAVVIAYPWKIDKSLYSMLPISESNTEIQTAESELSLRSASHLMIFVGDSNFSTAEASANEIGQLLLESKQIEFATWKIDSSSYEEVSNYLFENRFALQDPAILKMKDSARANYFLNQSLAHVYGSFAIADLKHLHEDPYLLAQNVEDRLVLKNPLLSGNLTLRNGMFTVEDSGKTYIFVNAEMASNVSDFASDDHVIAALENKIDLLKKAHPNLSVMRSGVPFHSYASSKKAQKEVAWISGISTVVVFALLLIVFRSAVPIIAILSSILIAILAATGATLAAFHEIHIFTFVFGTSVIGVSIDYALHHFADKNAQVKSILLGFMTTELSYVALMIVDFPVLRQMAFFSMIGLLSALLSVLLVFPKVSEKMKTRKKFSLKFPQLILAGYSKLERIPKIPCYLIFAVLIAALIPGFSKMNVRTDIRALYQVSKDLGESEMRVAKWMNTGISPTYFIVTGNSQEEVLEKEELLAEKLKAAEKDSLLKSFLAYSQFVPSEKRRAQMDSVLRHTLPLRYKKLCKALKIRPQKNPAALFGGISENQELPMQFKNLKEMLWIGEINGKFYSAVMPLHLSEEFNAENFEDTENGIFAVNKMKTINSALTELSVSALALVAFAYFAVFFILSFVYAWRDSLRIVRAPILACLFTLSMLGYLEIPVNFFAITGLILVLGIGIDYSLFFKDSADHSDSTAFAVLLSTLTTLFSFGTLSLSSFVPVSVLGLTVLLGISACFLLSPFTRN